MNLNETIKAMNTEVLEEGVGNEAAVKGTLSSLKQAHSSARGCVGYLDDASHDAYLDAKLVSEIDKIKKTLQKASHEIKSMIARKVKA